MSFLSSLMNALPGAAAQGLAWGIMAIGVYITFRILDVADLTVDGSLATGGAVCVMLIRGGFNPWIALLCAMLAGMLAGLVTGLFHTRCGIPAILAGILTQLALYSINLRIMDSKANQALSVDKYPLLLSQRYVRELSMNNPLPLLLLFTAAVIAILYWFFGTEKGSSLRATGANPHMARAQGINTNSNIVLGLMVSNGLVALSGALLAQFQGAALDEKPFAAYGHENIVIRDNYVKAAGGDGITVMYALRPLVEYNTADSVACEMNDRIYSEPGNRLGKVAAAIWPWKCKDALLRYNEAVDTRLNQDGMAYDADSGDGTVYEHNYSRMNEGGCVMFCLEEAIHNTFRGNVSYDDLGGTISPSQNPDALLEHNIFYVRDGVPFVRARMDGGSYTEKDDTILPLP